MFALSSRKVLSFPRASTWGLLAPLRNHERWITVYTYQFGRYLWMYLHVAQNQFAVACFIENNRTICSCHRLMHTYTAGEFFRQQTLNQITVLQFFFFFLDWLYSVVIYLVYSADLIIANVWYQVRWAI